MSTYYSVIFASVNSIVSEQLTIGLMMSDGKKVWFRYSKAKLSFMRNFFDSEAFLLLKTSLKNIELMASSHIQNNGTPEDILFNTPTEPSPFTIEYMRYLSRYSNATITYNNPVEIEAEATDELFNHLYTEFVFAEQKAEQKTSEIEMIKNKLRPRIYKQNKKQHQTWHEVRNSSFVKYVHVDETEQISDYMENHSVKPYF